MGNVPGNNLSEIGSDEIVESARDGMVISGFFFKVAATSFVVLVSLIPFGPTIPGSQMDFARLLAMASLIVFLSGVIALIWELNLSAAAVVPRAHGGLIG